MFFLMHQSLTKYVGYILEKNIAVGKAPYGNWG